MYHIVALYPQGRTAKMRNTVFQPLQRDTHHPLQLKPALVLMLVLLTLGLSAGAVGREYQRLLWIDLLPLEDYKALYDPPEINHSIGEDDEPGALLRNNTATAQSASDSAFEAALVSTKVVGELNELAMQLPGFIVPLEYNDEQKVTEFFLVPYFGACIHTPPPPPNQIAHVSYPEGFELTNLYDPFVIEGTLFTRTIKNDMATAAYRITADSILPYEAPAGEE
jgi:hypothetical protein